MVWPDGKKFAFTVFDDPDGLTRDARLHVYPLLRDLGFRTTLAVWPIGPLRGDDFRGETCALPEYRRDVQGFQKAGFEIAYHNAAPHSCSREEIIESLERFREYFGEYPVSMANHMDNADSIYWGTARLSGLRRTLYNAMTRGVNKDRFSGHVEGSQYFWGDVCRARLRYCRNFVYREINTLRVCPFMPYADPERPFVQEWFSAADGTDCASFVNVITEANQDRLEAEGGLCILYTHFGKYFVADDRVNPEFERLMRRLAGKSAWFAPVSTILDYLREKNGPCVITPAQRAGMEWRWLYEKARRGTS
ncbi:MAG TPA: hypothetical protein VGG72_03845 [Bryobacteraceae bacterium]